MATLYHKAIALLDIDSLQNFGPEEPRAELDLLGLVARFQKFGATTGVAVRNWSWPVLGRAMIEANGWTALSAHTNADDLICAEAERIATALKPRLIILATSDNDLIERVRAIAVRNGVDLVVFAQTEKCSKRTRRAARGKFNLIDPYVTRVGVATA